MSKQMSPLPGKHLAMSTSSLAEGQAVTSRFWSKHKSRVVGKSPYSSQISRLPLGQSWLCHVDCRSSMRVEPEGNRTKCLAYLPLAGSMKIWVPGKILAARPGGPVFLPASTPHVFESTPIRCVLLEIPATKLRTELAALGCTGMPLVPLSWAPRTSGAVSITAAVRFVLEELERGCGDRVVYLRRLEAVMLACLARALADQLQPHSTDDAHIGKVSIEQIKQRINQEIHSDLTVSKLAAFVGLGTRALQKQFLKYLNISPLVYLREQRLEAARQVLGDPRNRESVTEVATALKFHHLGRFAAAYRKKFGETPSGTLARRAQQRPDRPLSKKRTRNNRPCG